MEVKFHDLGTSKRGEENSLSNICFAMLVSILWRFYRANKKTCHVLFKKKHFEIPLITTKRKTTASRGHLDPLPLVFCARLNDFIGDT